MTGRDRGWGAEAGRFYFPVDRDLFFDARLRRQPDRDLWLWLVCTAARSAGRVRFSYGVFSDQTAWREGNKRCGHERKAIEGALKRLAAASRIVIPPSAERGDPGGGRR